MPRFSSTCISAAYWSARATRWSGIWRWTGACLTAMQERTRSWERRSFTHRRYQSTRTSVRVSGTSQPDWRFVSPAGLLLQRHSGGRAVTLLLDLNRLPQHRLWPPWYLWHTGHHTGPSGGLQVHVTLLSAFALCSCLDVEVLVSAERSCVQDLVGKD